MLLLLFYVGDNRYALKSRQVVQIFPNLILEKVHHAPEHISGLFNYGGQIVPVIDLSHLIQGKASLNILSTRIILVNNQTSGQSSTPQLLGLQAERATTTLDLPEADLKDGGIKLDAAPYLGKIFTDKQGMIQLIRVEYLFSATESIALLPEVHE